MQLSMWVKALLDEGRKKLIYMVTLLIYTGIHTGNEKYNQKTWFKGYFIRLLHIFK